MNLLLLSRIKGTLLTVYLAFCIFITNVSANPPQRVSQCDLTHLLLYATLFCIFSPFMSLKASWRLLFCSLWWFPPFLTCSPVDISQLYADTILHCHHEDSSFLFLLEFTHSCFPAFKIFRLFIHWAGAYPLTAFVERMFMRETLKDFKYFNWIYDWYKIFSYK